MVVAIFQFVWLVKNLVCLALLHPKKEQILQTKLIFSHITFVACSCSDLIFFIFYFDALESVLNVATVNFFSASFWRCCFRCCYDGRRCRCQFHQRFTREFFIQIFPQSQNVTREKLRKRCLYKKFVRKMLIKLKVGLTLASNTNLLDEGLTLLVHCLY